MDGSHQLEVVLLLLGVVVGLAIPMRNSETISDDLLYRLEHELDMEARRLGIEERRVGRGYTATAVK